MSIGLILLLFLIGVVLVVKGGDTFVDAASKIATELHIPKFLIGATIVSIATTLPELMVSGFASIKGQSDMAVGNAVGSVIANQGLIMAVAMIFMNYLCKRKDYLVQCLLLMVSVVLLWYTGGDGSVSIMSNIIFVIIFIAYMTYNVMKAKQASSDAKEVAEDTDKKDLTKQFILFLVGTVMIVIGSNLMVNYGGKLAEALGVPERVIAVTLVAVGTSLPELVTTITSIIKKEPSLSIGNIIGANILNVTMIMPVASFLSGSNLPISPSAAAIDLPWMVGMTLLALLPIIIRQKSHKLQGAIMFVAYIIYLTQVL